MNRRQKAIEHDKFTRRHKRGQVRSKGNGGRSFRLGPHAPRPRTHDDVVAAHRSGADRLRFCDRPVLQPLATDPRSPPRLSSNRAGIFGARADFVRHPGACHFDLAVLVDIRYLWGDPFTPIAGVSPRRECNRRLLRSPSSSSASACSPSLPCCSASPSPGQATETNQHFRHHPTNERRSRWLDPEQQPSRTSSSSGAMISASPI